MSLLIKKLLWINGKYVIYVPQYNNIVPCFLYPEALLFYRRQIAGLHIVPDYINQTLTDVSRPIYTENYKERYTFKHTVCTTTHNVK